MAMAHKLPSYRAPLLVYHTETEREKSKLREQQKKPIVHKQEIANGTIK